VRKRKISTSASLEDAAIRVFGTDTFRAAEGQGTQLRSVRKREIPAAVKNYTVKTTTEVRSVVNCLPVARQHPGEDDLLVLAGQMVYGVAHDIRHYLCCLVANVEMMCDAGMPSSARKQFIEEFHEVVEEACMMLDLPMAAAAGKDTCSMRLEKLDTLVERAIRRVRCHPYGKTVEVSFERSALPRQRVNGVMLSSAVFNLVLNACEAVARDDCSGRVDVSVRDTGSHIAIYVADNGPGLPDTVREFFPGSFWTQRRTGGFGLGLSVAARAALVHNGMLCIEESRSGRTVMALRIPRESAIAS